MDSDILIVHTVWAIFGFLLVIINGYFVYISSYDRRQLHVFIAGHLLGECLFGVFVLFTSAQWLIIGIPEAGIRCDVLSMVELVFMILPVLSTISVTYCRKKRMLDEEAVAGSASNYVLAYYAFAILFNVVVVELVGAEPTRFGCVADWQEAEIPSVFLVLGCAGLLWVCSCYIRIYRKVNEFIPTPVQVSWKEKQLRITLATSGVATAAVLCYVPNIASAIILYLERDIPSALRIVQFSARLLLGILVPLVYGLGVPSIRQRSAWAIPPDPKVVPSVFSANNNRAEDSDLCYFPINQNQSSGEQGEPLSRSSFSARERSSFDQNSSDDNEKHIPRGNSQIPRTGSRQGSRHTSKPIVLGGSPRGVYSSSPLGRTKSGSQNGKREGFYDEGRSDIVWSLESPLN